MTTKVFNFTKTEPVSPNFGKTGLIGTNFIDNSGAILYNIALLIMQVYFAMLILKVCIKFYKQRYAREVGMKIVPYTKFDMKK